MYKLFSLGVGTSLTAVILFGSLSAQALSCAAPNVSEVLAAGGGMAVGTVTSQEDLGVITNEYGQQVNKIRITFDLGKAWSTIAFPKTLVAIQHVPIATP